MKLISLSCNQPSFKTLVFNENGISIILGDGAKDLNGTSNGVGKTLSLKLIHHCLGANADPAFTAVFPEWIFSLKFKHENVVYVISRTGDGKKIWLGDQSISLTDYRNWLNEQNFFNLKNKISDLGFRSLFKRFSRVKKADCDSPSKTDKEQDYPALLRTMFLMGANHELIVNKHNSKAELDKANQNIKQYKEDPVLLDFFRAGTQPRIRLEFLEQEIPRLRKDINLFKVADDYRDIEIQANELTELIKNTAFEQESIKQQLTDISQMIMEQPDISKDDLLELYKGIEMVFKPEALMHFDSVEKFHQQLSVNRKVRLEEEKSHLLDKLDRLDSERFNFESERDQKIQYLHGKRALDDYVALTQELSNLNNEFERLTEYYGAISALEKKKLEIKQKRLEDDKRATAYVEANPLENFDKNFKSLANQLYPRTPAGITLSANTSDRNQIRFNLDINIEGDSSDGIGDAVILCFDWIILTSGLNHSIEMLWHDNRLFADIDPKVRSNWLSSIASEAEKRGLQYIISINTENFEAMEDYLSSEEYNSLKYRQIIQLKGDTPENKLLGIQFG
ncbi:DUF2326 domain-containing protein [Acinetobacter sp. 5862]|uniref:DUF2326 domain-containing protein n=1 Tax=Acinetobacter sp. 5862 TaxID=2967169 RepID=UPI0021126E21|nr:DUF2326 domain-containing protein [Acinetobacter sp. 5862]